MRDQIGKTAAAILSRLAEMGVKERANRARWIDAMVVTHRGIGAIGETVTDRTIGPAWCAHAVAAAWAWACLAHDTDPTDLLRRISGGAEKIYTDKRIPDAWRISPEQVRAGEILIPGDLVVRAGHVGMVLAEYCAPIDGEWITTVEGNTVGDMGGAQGVHVRRRSMGIGGIIGVTRPVP